MHRLKQVIAEERSRPSVQPQRIQELMLQAGRLRDAVRACEGTPWKRVGAVHLWAQLAAVEACLKHVQSPAAAAAAAQRVHALVSSAAEAQELAVSRRRRAAPARKGETWPALQKGTSSRVGGPSASAAPPSAVPHVVVPQCDGRGEGAHCGTTTDQLVERARAHLGHRSAAVRLLSSDTCSSCSVSMLVHAQEGLLMCPVCHAVRHVMPSTLHSVLGKEEAVTSKRTSYKPESNFSAAMANALAAERRCVPPDVLLAVCSVLHGEGVRDPHHVTVRRVAGAMRRGRGMQTWYAHAPQIAARLSGVMPPQLQRHQRAQLVLQFRAFLAVAHDVTAGQDTVALNYNWLLVQCMLQQGLYPQALHAAQVVSGKPQQELYDAVAAVLGWTGLTGEGAQERALEEAAAAAAAACGGGASAP